MASSHAIPRRSSHNSGRFLENPLAQCHNCSRPTVLWATGRCGSSWHLKGQPMGKRNTLCLRWLSGLGVLTRIEEVADSNPAVPRSACTLRRFPKGNDLYRDFGESLARYLDMTFKAGKHCALPGERWSCLQTQDKTCAALRASVLSQQDDARSAPLRSSAIPEPRRQRYARDVLRRKASQVQHDCAESTRLQQQIGDTLCLLAPRPGLCREG